MQSFIIKPILGLKTSVAPNDASLFQPLGDNISATHCVDGENVDYKRTRNTCSKAAGRTLWSNSATADATSCLGIFELYDLNGARTYWIFMGDNSSKGRIFRYDGSKDPVRVSDQAPPAHSGAIEWAFNTLDLYSIIRYGNYIVFADWMENTPYCALDDATTLSKLISSGTEYKFRYIESWQRRIFGAYTNQTNGRLEVRWSNLQPTPSSDCTFAAADALFVQNDDTITGIKRMGRNACFVYSENSIHRIDYYPNYTIPFGVITVVDNIGAVNHHSIVDAGGMHYFFNKDYGFCEFNGQQVKPISNDIEDTVSAIRPPYYGHIVGDYVPYKNQVIWTVPVEASITPNKLLVYDRDSATWDQRNITAHYVARYTLVSSLTMQEFIDDYGYATMSSAGNLAMAELISETPRIMVSNTDGKLYHIGGESDNGSAWDGFRVEPVLDFGRPSDKDLLSEIWFDITATGNYNIYCYYRGGDTVGEVVGKNWTALPEVSCNSPTEAATYLAETNRFHQIKWGTDGASEPFVVSQIEFRYVPGGRY